MKKVFFLLLIIVFCAFLMFVYNQGLLSPFKFALPWQSCGGSTLKAKKCVTGFKCKISSPGCDGCGGICVPSFNICR